MTGACVPGQNAVKYRMAREEDLADLAEMRWDFRTETEGETPAPAVGREEFTAACTEFLKQGLADRRWVYWVAELDGQIVSHIFVQRVQKVPKPSRLHDEYGYVTNVYTRPPYRGQGIGSELLECVRAWARGEDLEVLIVWPSEESVAFYERAGFSTQNDVLEYTVRTCVV